MAPGSAQDVATDRSLLDRLARIPAGGLLGAASLIFLLLSYWEMRDESITTDELVHLSAGFTYLSTGDFRLNPEHPVLAKVMAAAPLFFMNLKWPEPEEHWEKAQEWQFGYKFLYQAGNPSEAVLFAARVPMLFWGLLTLGTVYALTRELFGLRGAFIALGLATFCPMLLGHAHLVTTDVPVAAMFLLTAAGFWWFSEKPGAGRATAAGVLLGGALLVKYSAVMMGPALAWSLLACWSRRWKTLEERGLGRRERFRDLGRNVLYLALIAGTAVFLLWACYRFRYRASPDPDFRFDWSFEIIRKGAIGKAIFFGRDHRLLPEAYLNGFAYMFESAQVRSAYALGQYSQTGWWWYFPFAFLVKTPLPMTILMGWGCWASFRRYRTGWGADYFLVVPLIVFGVLAMASNINIGLRHIMPAYPVLFVLAGGIPLDSTDPRRALVEKRSVAALLGLTAAGCLLAGPYYLAYFNLPSTLVFDRHFMLSDSNLDWGQDLRRLKQWMEKEKIPSLTLAYFGNASPRELRLDHVRQRAANMYAAYEREWDFDRQPQEGDLLAVSATNYSGVVLGNPRDYYRTRLSGLRPIAIIGHSILIYRLPKGFQWTP